MEALLPQDPTPNAPFQMAVSEASVCWYSVGKNKEGNGGTVRNNSSCDEDELMIRVK
jgi:hypothetical protein